MPVIRKPYPSELQERFIVRMPENMRSRLADEAKKNNRSMNAEVIVRLEKSFQTTSNAGAGAFFDPGNADNLRADMQSLGEHFKRLEGLFSKRFTELEEAVARKYASPKAKAR